MRKLVLAVIALALASMVQAQNPPAKVGVIHIQNAIIGTKEGQKAAADLEARMVAPKRKEMEDKQAEITRLQQQLDKGKNTMSEEARQKLMRDIDTKTKAFNRANEDAQAELEQEQSKLLNDLGGKIMAVINKYAQDNGYAIIFDVSNQNTPVLWIANAIDITQEIVALYDKNTPGGGTTAPASRGGSTAPAPAAKPPAPKPPVTSPTKKPPEGKK